MNPLTDPEQFQAWKAHPVTEPFLAYLKDRQQVLLENWGKGLLMEPNSQTVAMILGQLADLSCNHVRDFYDLEQIAEVEASE